VFLIALQDSMIIQMVDVNLMFLIALQECILHQIFHQVFKTRVFLIALQECILLLMVHVNLMLNLTFFEHPAILMFKSVLHQLNQQETKHNQYPYQEETKHNQYPYQEETKHNQ
jgi:hypothetical protein